MTVQLDRPETEAPARPLRTTGIQVMRRKLLTGAAMVGLVLWAAARSVPEREVVNRGGLSLLDDLAATALNPSFDPAFLRIVLDATVTTAAFALLGTIGALALGLVGGVILSDIAWDRHPPSPVRALRLVLRVVLVAVRAVHELVWALLFVSVLGLDPLVAVLALALPFGAQTAQVFGETIDAVPEAPLRSLRDAGARQVPALAYGLFPQALPLMLSYAFYRFECALRSVVVLGVAGVGGLGFELSVSLQSRNWDEVWTLTGALLMLAALVELWSNRVRCNLAIVTCADWAVGQAQCLEERHSARLSRPVRASLWAVPVAAVASWWWVDLSPSGLFSERTRSLTSRLLSDMWPPALPDGGWSVLLGSALDTVAMAVLAMVLGVGITLAIGPWASRPRRGRDGSTGPLRWVAWVVARAVLLVLRSVPPTVWAVVTLLGLFPGIIPGAVALGLYTGGILARLVAEAWETVDLRPRDALRDAGVAPSVSAMLAVGPPSARHLLTYTLYRFEICIRDTAIVGVVGAAGLGRLLQDRLGAFDFAAVSGVLIASFVVSALVELVSRQVRRGL